MSLKLQTTRRCHPELDVDCAWKDEKANGSSDHASEIRGIIAILHKWGVHTLGQFGALEKEQLSIRLGPEVVRMWERANGKATRLLKLVPPPETFEESFEFEHEIEVIDPLLFILRRFLEQLALQLQAVYHVAQELELRISFTDKNSYTRVFRIPQPTTDVEVLFRMLHTHLEQFKSEHPITAVTLTAHPAKPAQQQFGLFETALRDPNQLSETLARLTGLLGADRVGTPVLEETFRPDAFRMKPFAWEAEDSVAKPGGVVPNDFGARGGLALRRLRFAAPASVLLDENKPAHLRSAELQGEVVRQDGPYMASGNWWDEKAWARAEWDLQLASGALCRCHEHEQGWALDGIYD